MDRNWRRSQRDVLSSSRPASRDLRSRSGCSRSDQRVHERDPFDKRWQGHQRAADMLEEQSTRELQRGSPHGYQYRSQATSLLLAVHTGNRHDFVLWSGTDLYGRQYEEEEYALAIR